MGVETDPSSSCRFGELAERGATYPCGDQASGYQVPRHVWPSHVVPPTFVLIRISVYPTWLAFRSRVQTELSEEIRKETQKYFRHSSKNAGQPLPGKDAAIPDTVSGLYADLDALAAEKVDLSDRLVKIFERAMARLQHDLQKILKLQGEEPGLPPTQHFLSSVESTVQQIQSLRAAAQAIEVPTAPVPVPVAPPAQKSTYPAFRHCVMQRATPSLCVCATPRAVAVCLHKFSYS